jgi:tRNA threonylcarbamoyladenosine biosynthesis protein TsaB
MAWILNIETSTHVCSVSLARDGVPVNTRESREDKSHARLLTRYIREILDGHKLKAPSLDAVAVSKGPGSYTGLRIGVSTAKGLAYGAGIRLIGINSLQALSQAVIMDYPKELTADDACKILLCPMIDARRMEVYMALYDTSGQPVKETGAVIITADTFASYTDKYTLWVFGTGAAKCREIIDHPGIRFLDDVEPSAKNMAGLSEKAFHEQHFEDVAYFEPFYLKDFIATIPKNKVIGNNN